jgi:hypothetical protein
MPDRSKVMIQTKRGRLILQAGGYNPTPYKALIVEKLSTTAAREKRLKRHGEQS